MINNIFHISSVNVIKSIIIYDRILVTYSILIDQHWLNKWIFACSEDESSYPQ